MPESENTSNINRMSIGEFTLLCTNLIPCYEGQEISVVAHMSRGYMVAIKGGRYNLDHNLASAILIGWAIDQTPQGKVTPAHFALLCDC